MAKYHVFDDMPGLERGLGNSRIPAPLMSATEYNDGPNAWGAKLYRRALEEQFPLLYVCGAYPTAQPPDKLCNSALLSSLYYGGWYVWYSELILEGSRSREYLDGITAMHQRLDQLLKQPRNQWPDPPPLIER